jgi:hypothetical protein
MAWMLPLYRASDFIRRSDQLARHARGVVQRLGATERAWEIVDLAATVERVARDVEAEMDNALAGRSA